MIFDQQTGIVVGNLGWVDRGSLWIFDAGSDRERHVPFSDARYVRVSPGRDGVFLTASSLVTTPKVSIRAFDDPEHDLAGLDYEQGEWRLTGEVGHWAKVEPTIILYRNEKPSLLTIDPATARVTELDLGWLNADNYDLGYQGLVGCLAMPNSDSVLVSVQRSSGLVEMDRKLNVRLGIVNLGDRGGNPHLRALPDGRILASDYDMLCIFDPLTRQTVCSDILQQPAPPNTAQFIGDYDVRGTDCIVARPFSGDVLRLDLATLTVADQAPIGGQPLSVCWLEDDEFLTRDWKTGKVRRGQF